MFANENSFESKDMVELLHGMSINMCYDRIAWWFYIITVLAIVKHFTYKTRGWFTHKAKCRKI